MRGSGPTRGIRATAYGGGVQENSAPFRRRIEKVHRGTSEPPSVALLRHVLNPSVIVLSLVLCVLMYAQELTGDYMALAALAFLISAQCVSDPVLDSSARKGVIGLLQH